jgi:hypothetical protein
MSRVYVFGDEAGDLTFRRGAGISEYFIVGTATMADCSVGQAVLDLRRELAWQGMQLEMFHACEDKQRVRDRVFDVIAQSNVRVDATILHKPKAQPHLANDPLRFYKEAWYLHFKYVAPRVCNSLDDLFVVVSSMQINRKKHAVKQAVEDIVRQASPTAVFHSAFFSAVSDPCLQVADYVTWAIQRKFERGDERSYNLVKHLVRSEFQPFLQGQKTYY